MDKSRGPIKIVLTGGPCGGKSSGIATLEQSLSDKGYKVFVLEEMATTVINSGAAPWVVGGKEFQKALIKMQHERNKVYEDLAKHMKEQVIIINDRGLIDGKAFLENFDDLLKECNLNSVKARDYYDGVFHLVTAANGAEKFYTLANNKARTETSEQAIIVDNKLKEAWTGHPHLRIIDNENVTFEQKIDRLIKEVYSMIGIPVPLEIERKYLIEYPNLLKLALKYNGVYVNIIQTYLKSDDINVERRIRQRGSNGEYSYYYTEKVNKTGLIRSEFEHKITESEYTKLLIEADTSFHQIRKDRLCFIYNGLYLELDTYPFWMDKAILEIELSSENGRVDIPPEIEVIEEVTEDIRYKNISLAKNYGNI